ncbi:MAG: enoyl-CoA hydratase/isomerase family protein [Methylocella sp.]
MGAADVIIETIGRCGAITLNRPAALNSLDLAMVRAIAGALDLFENDAAIRCVLIQAAGERAFCAGADIRALYELGKAGRRDAQLDFFRAEYRLNRRIKLYPKPTIALVGGIVMGGGAGLSVHATHCVAGETLDFAMPEAGIGFFPDVGATFFLPRLPGRFGAYLALTGARIGCGDALALGLASAHVASSRRAALIQSLIDGEDAAAAIGAQARPAPPSALIGRRPFIDRCFAAPTVAAIVANVAAEGGVFASETRAALAAKSPTSLAIALRQMRIGAGLCIDEALRTEFRIAARILEGADYYEGVRAAIVDKDRRPRWRPDAVDAVSEAEIDAYFEPRAEELTFSATDGAR